MKKRKVGIGFNYRNCDAFARYLHEQSLRGQHFKEFRLGLVFEIGEPADIYYAVEVFPKGSEMDTRPEKSTEEYAEYCEAAGWRLIDSSRKFCVFRRTKEDAVPIVEPKERFANIRKAEWLLWLNRAVPFFLLTFLYGAQLLTGNFGKWIFSNAMLHILLFMMLFFIEYLLDGILLLYWSVTRGRMLRAGHVPIYGGGKHRTFIVALPFILFLVSAAFLALSRDGFFLPYVLPSAAATVFVLLTVLWIAYRRPSRSDNLTFQILAGLGFTFLACFGTIVIVLSIGNDSRDEARFKNAEDFPLIQEDYRQMDGEITWTLGEYTESILGSAGHFFVTYSIEESGKPHASGESSSDNLWYTIYQSPHPWILDKLWEEEIPESAGHPEDRSKAWDALSAVSWTRENGVCIEMVRYPDRLFVINSEVRLDDRQIRMIREKLMHET